MVSFGDLVGVTSSVSTSATQVVGGGRLGFWVTWITLWVAIAIGAAFFIRKIVMIKHVAFIFEKQGSGYILKPDMVMMKKDKDRKKIYFLGKSKAKLVYSPLAVSPYHKGLFKRKTAMFLFHDAEDNYIPVSLVDNETVIDADTGKESVMPIIAPIPKDLRDAAFSNLVSDAMIFKNPTWIDKFGPWSLVMAGLVGAVIFLIMTKGV